MSKILIVGTAYPYRGGIAAFNERLARQFQEEGDEVEIWTFTLQYPNFLFPGKTQYSTDSAPESLNIKRVVNSVNPFNWLKVGRKINQGHYDKVVFAYWMSFMAPCFGTIARQIKRDKTIRCVALVHNMLPHDRIGTKDSSIAEGPERRTLQCGGRHARFSWWYGGYDTVFKQ